MALWNNNVSLVYPTITTVEQLGCYCGPQTKLCTSTVQKCVAGGEREKPLARLSSLLVFLSIASYNIRMRRGLCVSEGNAKSVFVLSLILLAVVLCRVKRHKSLTPFLMTRPYFMSHINPASTKSLTSHIHLTIYSCPVPQKVTSFKISHV